MSSPGVRKGKVCCCVVGCGNGYGNTGKTVSFYRFPADNYISRSRRKAWISALNRQNLDGGLWHPTKNSRICSTHFVGGAKSEHPRHPAYNPTIFPTHTIAFKPMDNGRLLVLRLRDQSELLAKDNLATCIKLPIIFSREVGCQTDNVPDILNAHQVLDKTFVSCFYFRENVGVVDSATQTTIVRASPVKTTTDQGSGPVGHVMLPRCLNCDSFHGSESIKTNEQMLDFTGITRNIFTNLLEFLKSRKEFKVTKADRLLIFLMKLKTDFSFASLSIIFCLHRSTVSRIFFDVLASLTLATKDYICWPNKDTIIKTLPKCFKTHYPQCRVMINYTELEIQQLPNISDKFHVNSHHKGIRAVKSLLGITPSGVIAFRSAVYDGKMSDVQIIAECGILEKVEKDDIVLVEKNFPGKKDVDNVIVVMPTFSYDDTLMAEEVTSSLHSANIRIHFEQTISRIKQFRILQNKLHMMFHPHLDEILHIICVLVNLMGPSIKDTLQ